jgi:SpoIID/LytB domain protein
MLKILPFFFLFLFSSLKADKEQVNIKILLEEKLDGILLETNGNYKLVDLKDNSIIARASGKTRHYLSSYEKGIKWGKEFNRIFQCKIIAKDDQATFLLDGIQYKGSLEIYLIGNKLYLINEIGIEEYIVSSLSKEFALKNYFPATYESLAIIARTKIYHKLMHSKNKFFTFKANSSEFLGYSYNLVNSPIQRAAEATKDLMLTYKNKPFCAFWTEHSAGQTANYSTILRKKTPSPEGVFVAYSQKEKLASRYRFTISKQDFCKYLGILNFKSINLFCDKISNKIYAVQIRTSKKTIELPFLTFQKLIGKNELKSNCFEVKSKNDSLIFEGYGEGLGLGLCIFSANEMASRSENSPRILKYFYPQTSLVKISQIAEDLNKPLSNLALSQIFDEEIFE